MADPPTVETLVVMIGSLRGGEPTWRSAARHLLVPNSADLALMIGELPHGSKRQRTLLEARAKYVWTIRERSDEGWADALDDIGRELGVANATAWRDDVGYFRVRNSTWMSPIFLGPSRWSASINLIMRWEVKRNLIRYGLLDEYKRFMVTRTDHFYACPLQLSALATSLIWVPEGEDYGGLCDRAILCDRDDILNCLSIIDGYLEHPYRYPAWLNPEKLLMVRLQHMHMWQRVRRFRRVMFISSVEGDRSRSLVSRESQKTAPRLGISYKYPREFGLALSTCGYTEEYMRGKPSTHKSLEHGVGNRTHRQIRSGAGRGKGHHRGPGHHLKHVGHSNASFEEAYG